MKSASECRAHAADCRALAHRMDDERRRHFLQIAETWENLARDREEAQELRATG